MAEVGTPSDPLGLADWRRRVAELYAAVRARAQVDPRSAWLEYRSARDSLFRSHPQTPLSERQVQEFAALPYFDYDPAWRLQGSVLPHDEGEVRQVDLGEDGLITYRAIGAARFDAPHGTAELQLYWVEGYGGGLFMPFLDRTNGISTYGGGRYLLDGIKGADLGTDEDQLILDFNFAYNPSCVYNERWVCPLPDPVNRLPFEVPVGEKDFTSG
jgi:uncharacterized protein (DUF1684 family)